MRINYNTIKAFSKKILCTATELRTSRTDYILKFNGSYTLEQGWTTYGRGPVLARQAKMSGPRRYF